KIFALCNQVPVGIMIYNNAEYAGVPWETVVKLFRSEECRTFSTVADGFEAFKKFLTNKRLADEEAETNSFILFASDLIESRLKGKLIEVPKRGISTALRGLIDKEIGDLPNNKKMDFESGSYSAFSASRRSDVRVIADEVFRDLDYKLPNNLVAAV